MYQQVATTTARADQTSVVEERDARILSMSQEVTRLQQEVTRLQQEADSLRQEVQASRAEREGEALKHKQTMENNTDLSDKNQVRITAALSWKKHLNPILYLWERL